MQKEYIKSYKFSILCILLIWILCFMSVPEIEIAEDVPFIDKWTHIVMYLGTCSIIWIEYYRKHGVKTNKRKLMIGAILLPILMSGVIELMQAYLTGGRRSGDWLDLAANTIGVALAAILGSLVYKRFFK